MASFIYRNILAAATIIFIGGIPRASQGADPKRQAQVAERGKDVMPFNVEETTHIFTTTPSGGLERSLVKPEAMIAGERLPGGR
ncbi:MAG: hypothetical protein JWR22_2820 [Herminiimonas sp.]|nr:hypothetical protein [Herminiimonas sp.]